MGKETHSWLFIHACSIKKLAFTLISMKSFVILGLQFSLDDILMVIHLLQKHDLAKCPLQHITITFGNINNTKIGITLVHLHIKFHDWFKLTKFV